MKNYNYDVIGADIDFHVAKHPIQDIKDLGFHIIKAEAFPIVDCWIFRVDNENEVVNIPAYIRPVSDNFKFTGE